MSANPIDLDARRSCPNLEARSGRPRRWSTDPARHSYYQWARQRRLAQRLLGKMSLDVFENVTMHYLAYLIDALSYMEAGPVGLYIIFHEISFNYETKALRLLSAAI